MAQASNHLEVYKLLPKTNCRECDFATCLAFAVAVVQGRKGLGDCPRLSPEARQAAPAAPASRPAPGEDPQQAIAGLQERVGRVDLAAAAAGLKADYREGKLFINCLGKDFAVDQQGRLASSCHVNVWVTAPLLHYVLGGGGPEPSGEWVPLRDLPGGADWGRFFEHRCEKELKKVIDGYTGLMEDLVDIFAGRPAPAAFDSDIAVVIRPLPKLPVLLCYWKAEDGMDSSLHLFFDRTAEDNLRIESIYTLGVGLTTMFQKIALTHGR
ncbi:MAG: DUF3786 domain-containing protein [Desulfarculus sp.]|nr:MAG: DUF3786 domain-containing protein [Desulfarculus sp.]